MQAENPRQRHVSPKRFARKFNNTQGWLEKKQVQSKIKNKDSLQDQSKHEIQLHLPQTEDR